MTLASEFDYNLTKLAEESGELVQIAMKSLIYGIDSKNPDTGEVNRDLIMKEMCDVMVSIQLVGDAIGFKITQEFIDQRKEILKRYFIMSQMK